MAGQLLLLQLRYNWNTAMSYGSITHMIAVFQLHPCWGVIIVEEVAGFNEVLEGVEAIKPIFNDVLGVKGYI